MTTKKRVLMSGAGGSLFPYLFNSLEKKYFIVGIDSNKMVKKTYPNQEILTVPLVLDKAYEETVKGIMEKYRLEYYIPGIDEEIIKAYKIVAGCKGAKLISPQKGFVEFCLDKFALAKELAKQEISNVETFLAKDYDQQLDFPVFVKPRTSRGSRGIRKIANKEQLEAYFHLENYTKEEVVVQEYLDGVEYTVSVVVNNLNKLMAIVPKKVITKRGITQCAVTEKNSAIEKTCRMIVEKLNPCGSFNVQLTVTKKGVQIFEINPRFSTTSILTVEAGINEFDLVMEYFDKEKAPYLDSFKEDLFLFRRWDSVFYK